jgi:hypothetical protein
MYAIIMCLLMVGCADLLQLQPKETTPAATVINETFTSVAGQTLVPVSEVTGLPEHAPTITRAEVAVETGLSEDILQETSVPDDPAPLVDPNARFQEADIKILKPGSHSLLVSPFRVSAFLEPDPNYLIDLRLVGEDGRTLSEKTVMAVPWEGQSTVTMVTLIEFEIPTYTELGRLEIFVKDEFGRSRALNSIDVILLSEGTSMRNYAEKLQDDVAIHYPLLNSMVQGDTLLVSGLVRTPSEKPLELQLIDETNTIIGSTDAAVLLSEDSPYGLFAGEIHYAISKPTWVRLVIHVPGDRIPGTAYIKTMQVLLNP